MRFSQKTKQFRATVSIDDLSGLCVFGGHGRGLCVFGGLCVDVWRLVHQLSFLLFWLSFDCFWRLAHSWYQQGTNRHKCTKTVPTVFQSSKTVKTAKMTIGGNRHMFTLLVALNYDMTLKSEAEVIQGRWKWRRSINHIRLSIDPPF